MNNVFIGIMIGYFIGKIFDSIINSYIELILLKIEVLKQNITYNTVDTINDVEDSHNSSKNKNPIGFKYEGSEKNNGSKKKKK